MNEYDVATLDRTHTLHVASVLPVDVYCTCGMWFLQQDGYLSIEEIAELHTLHMANNSKTQ